MVCFKSNLSKKKYPGITGTYLKKQNLKKVMLIYNKKLSVSPITTHCKICSKNLSIKKIRKYNFDSNFIKKF